MARLLDSEDHICRAACYPPPMCLEEAAGGWQDPARTSEAIVVEASVVAYIAPQMPTPYAAAHITTTLRHHLQLPHRRLHVQPKQHLQEENGAETPQLPFPSNWTKGFPWCSRRRSSQGHDSASMKVTAPSGVTVVSASCRHAGICPRPMIVHP